MFIIGKYFTIYWQYIFTQPCAREVCLCLLTIFLMTIGRVQIIRRAQNILARYVNSHLFADLRCSNTFMHIWQVRHYAQKHFILQALLFLFLIGSLFYHYYFCSRLQCAIIFCYYFFHVFSSLRKNILTNLFNCFLSSSTFEHFHLAEWLYWVCSGII